MDTELLRDRLRRAAGTLPDSAHVTLAVRDVLACLAALDEVEAMGDWVSAEDHKEEVGELERECAELDARVAELETLLAQANAA